MPEKILTIGNSIFFVTCRIGDRPNLPVCNPGCHLDCKTGGRKMAWLPVYSEWNSIRKNAVFPVWRPGNTAEPEFLRPAGCMRYIRKCERCVHKKGVKNNAEK